jgi:hypothetical protein
VDRARPVMAGASPPGSVSHPNRRAPGSTLLLPTPGFEPSHDAGGISRCNAIGLYVVPYHGARGDDMGSMGGHEGHGGATELPTAQALIVVLATFAGLVAVVAILSLFLPVRFF